MYATTSSSSAVRLRVTEAEWQTRVDLAACYRLAAKFGWADHIYTHFSARIPGAEDHFLINAFGLTFPEVTASNLVKVDAGGNVLLDVMGYGINRAGYVIHSAVHLGRPDLFSVLHTHTKAGVAVSAQRHGLLMISQHAARYHRRVAYHDYEGFAFNEGERARLLAALDDKRVMILRNHGLLAAGRSIAEAFQELYFLERSCEIQIAALAGGAELNIPDEAVLQETARTYEALTGGAFSQRNWDAFIRDLAAIDPSYAS